MWAACVLRHNVACSPTRHVVPLAAAAAACSGNPPSATQPHDMCSAFLHEIKSMKTENNRSVFWGEAVCRGQIVGWTTAKWQTTKPSPPKPSFNSPITLNYTLRNIFLSLHRMCSHTAPSYCTQCQNNANTPEAEASHEEQRHMAISQSRLQVKHGGASRLRAESSSSSPTPVCPEQCVWW